LYNGALLAFSLLWFEAANAASLTPLVSPWVAAWWHIGFTALPTLVVGGWQSELALAAATAVPEVYGDARDKIRTGHKAAAVWVRRCPTPLLHPHAIYPLLPPSLHLLPHNNSGGGPSLDGPRGLLRGVNVGDGGWA
jgi:hypothetical protein